MNEHVESLRGLPRSKWHIHEAVLCRRLGLVPKEGIAVRGRLSRLISFLKKGSEGSPRKGTAIACHYGAIDIKAVEENILGVNYINHGRCEEFTADSLAATATITAIPRYFSFGAKISVSRQLEFVKAFTGANSATMKKATRTRRANNWLLWYRRDSGHDVKSFEALDLAVLLLEFQDLFDHDCNMSTIHSEIRALLVASNAVKGRTRMSASVGVDLSMSNKRFCATPSSNSGVATLLNRFEDVGTGDEDVNKDLVPHALSKAVLGALVRESNNALDELASLEYVLHLVCVQGMKLDNVVATLKASNVAEPTSITVSVIAALNQRARTWSCKNISVSRKHVLSRFPQGLFQPSDTELLYEWMKSGREYTKGTRLPPSNYTMHQGSLSHTWKSMYPRNQE